MHKSHPGVDLYPSFREISSQKKDDSICSSPPSPFMALNPNSHPLISSQQNASNEPMENCNFFIVFMSKILLFRWEKFESNGQSKEVGRKYGQFFG